MYYPLNIGTDGYQLTPQGDIGNILSQLIRLMPFQAGQQLAPQGVVGNLLSQLGQPFGGAIGGALGNQGLGSAIGGLASKLGSFLPSRAGQQWTPQGVVGTLLSLLGQPFGGAIGGALGNQGLGSAIGALASRRGSVLTCTDGQQLAPQGDIGNILSQLIRLM